MPSPSTTRALPLLALVLLACGGATPSPQNASPRNAQRADVDPDRGPGGGGVEQGPLEGPAGPARFSGSMVRIDLRDENALTSAGFTHHEGGASTFSGGVLRTETSGFEEWALRRDNQGAGSRWWQEVDAERGWVVEARLRVLEEGPTCSSVGIWIHDGTHLLKLGVAPGRAGIVYPFSDLRDVGPTDRFRTYRVEGLGQSLRVLVDGQTILERDGSELGGGGGTETLMFGDLGGCGRSVVEWEYFAYDTRPTFPTPPCVGCREQEHLELARFRRELGAAGLNVDPIDTRHTRDAETACIARDALDRTTHLLLPEVLDLAGRPEDAARLRAIAPFFDTRGLVDAAPLVVQALLNLPPRAQAQPPTGPRRRGTRKRMVRRDEYDEPPPPPRAPWLDAMRQAFVSGAAEQPQVALRNLRQAILGIRAEGYPVGPTIERMVSEIASAARTRCTRRN